MKWLSKVLLIFSILGLNIITVLAQDPGGPGGAPGGGTVGSGGAIPLDGSDLIVILCIGLAYLYLKKKKIVL